MQVQVRRGGRTGGRGSAWRAREGRGRRGVEPGRCSASGSACVRSAMRS